MLATVIFIEPNRRFLPLYPQYRPKTLQPRLRIPEGLNGKFIQIGEIDEVGEGLGSEAPYLEGSPQYGQTTQIFSSLLKHF